MSPRTYWLGWSLMALLFLVTKLVDWFLMTRR